MVEAGELRKHAVARPIVAGDGDEKRPRARIALAQSPGDLVTAEVRHAKIEQYDIRPEIANAREHAEPGVDAAYFVPFLAQQRAQAFHRVRIVVADENAKLRR
ncbi:MAG TPA: hypothetical protein VIV54_10270 [Burkholderiales bacterium]